MITNVCRPLASVVITNYNGKNFLEKCICSVLNSNFCNFEIIFVDDGSADGSSEFIIRRFCTDPRIKIIINKKNQGPAKSRNIGIKHAKGKYIVFLDNDTEVAPNWIRELVKVMETDSCVGVAQSKLLFMGNPKILDSAGGLIYDLGIPKVRGLYEKDEGQYDNLCEVFLG